MSREPIPAPTGLHALVIENVIRIRKACGWTQAQVPGFDRSTLGKLENGLRGITVDDLEKLGKAFRVQPWRLLRPLSVSVVVTDGPEAITEPQQPSKDQP